MKKYLTKDPPAIGIRVLLGTLSTKSRIANLDGLPVAKENVVNEKNTYFETKFIPVTQCFTLSVSLSMATKI